MKKLFSTLIVLFLLFSGNVNAQSMIPLKQYVKENKQYSKDPITQTYVLKRCSAAYIYASAITKDKLNPGNLLSAFQKTFDFAKTILMKKMKWSEEVAEKSLETDIDNMMKFYEKDGHESFAKTGMYMMDNYIGEDLKFCKSIVESIK